MIGKLKGIVEEIGEDKALIDVNGVCYIAFMSPRALEALPPEGQATALFIETHVREDHIHLFGFNSAEERAWFNLLCTVQGVGAKMGLAILSSFAPAEISHAIQAKDAKILTRASGVGPKLAERLVTELKNKVAKLPTSGSGLPPVSGSIAGNGAGGAASAASKPPLSVVKTAGNAMEEAVSALVNLGYGRSEAYSAITLAQQKTGSEALDDLIRNGLQELAS